MRFTFFLLAASLLAQTNTVIPSTITTVAPGQPITITLALDAAPPNQIAGLQFTLTAPASFGNPTPAVIGTAATAQKTLFQCRPAASGGNLAHTCLQSGQNQTAVANGQVATLTFAPGTPVPVGTYQVTIGNVVASSGNASGVALLPGPAVTVTVGIFGDINGDGRFDSADSLAFQLQILTTPCTPAMDYSGDGKCDVVDVQRFINRGLGAP